MAKMTEEDRQKYEQVRTEYYDRIDSRTDLTDEQKQEQRDYVDDLIAQDQDNRFGEDDNVDDTEEPDGLDGKNRDIDEKDDDDEIDR